MKTAILLLSILSMGTVACSSKGEKKDPGEGKSAKVAPVDNLDDDDPSKVIDWQSIKRSVIKETVDGIPFIIEIPEHRLLKKEIKKNDGTFPGYVTWSLGFRDGPGFTVQPADYPASEETLKESLLGQGQSVTLVEALPDGGWLQVVDEDSKKYYLITVYRKNAAGQSVRFSVSERRRNPIPGYDAEKAWAITVAKSFKLP
ncbi:MAG: hypothetical protein CVU65_12615 [Deltaproteobacteria bacterium HGW-Deltaproteobacteria-22]|nr:MAG: hypothetical protein CVU65_12615 [Deltaproteobacteria bacterium HGW-Deltaproteobacteria-22]